MLKIGYLKTSNVSQNDTGIFSFLNQFEEIFESLNCSKKYKFTAIIDDNQISSQGTNCIDLGKYIKDLTVNKPNFIQIFRYRIGCWIKLFLRFFLIDINVIHPSGNIISNYGDYKQIRRSALNNLIDDNEIDLMIFANQCDIPTTDRPYIFIVWDLSHRSLNTFSLSDFEEKDKEMRVATQKAFKVITGNSHGKQELCRFMGVQESSIKIIPFSIPKHFLENNNAGGEFKYENRKPYLFYPAAIIPFKNHITIIKAIKLLKDNGIIINLLFSGPNRGNLDFLESMTKEIGISDQISFLGMVSIGELKSLYANALGHVMASIMGPNNLPPIEAMAMGCPVIASKITGHVQQLEDAAIYFKPFDEVELANCIQNLFEDNEMRKKMIKKGYGLVKNLQPIHYTNSLCEVFDEFEKLRGTWGKLKQSY